MATLPHPSPEFGKGVERDRFLTSAPSGLPSTDDLNGTPPHLEHTSHGRPTDPTQYLARLRELGVDKKTAGDLVGEFFDGSSSGPKPQEPKLPEGIGMSARELAMALSAEALSNGGVSQSRRVEQKPT